jgi:hypothetical protein
MPVKFTNNASGTLASSITTSSTTITLTTGQGAQFPSLAAGEFFFATLVDSSNNLEIVKVTGRATDVLTIVRAQDNTSARAFVGGDRFELRPVAAALQALLQDAKDYSDASAGSLINAHISNPTGAHAASAVSFTPTGTIAAVNVQAALAELDTEKAPVTTTITGSAGITTAGNLGSGVTISPTSGYNGFGLRTVSTSGPAGGNDGDIWYQVA